MARGLDWCPASPQHMKCGISMGYASKFSSVSISCTPTMCSVPSQFLPLGGSQPRLGVCSCTNRPWCFQLGAAHLDVVTKHIPLKPHLHQILASLGGLLACWQALSQGFLEAQEQARLHPEWPGAGALEGLWGTQLKEKHGAIHFTQRFRKQKVRNVWRHRPEEQDLLFHMSQTLSLESNGISVHV